MQHGLHGPQVCRLPNECRSVDLLKFGKKVLVMPLKVAEDRRIGVFLEELSDELTGELGSVVNGRVRAVRTQGTPLVSKLAFEVGKQVISETGHLDNEYIKSHDWRKGLISGVYCSQPEIRASPVCFLPQKPAHRVS